jgi:hypothetical chaperone protein
VASLVFGLDFGTTNSSLCAAASDGTVTTLRFPAAAGPTESFRSLLYLERQEGAAKGGLNVWSGPDAVQAYLEAEIKGRLVQSLKSFLTSRSLRGTDVFGRQYSLEDLIARIIRPIRTHAEHVFHTPVRSAVVGRPVNFVGSESETDNLFAVERLRTALRLAGFEDVRFEYEPVGAALHYESTLDHEELILIGDFGGGTSDFSLLRVGNPKLSASERILGNAGVGLAGDAFDAKIVRHVVSPALGAGTEMQSVDKVLPVPQWVYGRLERWHYVSFLKTREILNMLRSVEAQAFEPEKIAALLRLIEDDLGYYLHSAVQHVKIQLSSAQQALFRFDDGMAAIERTVKRHDFEDWIGEELELISRSVDQLLGDSGIGANSVDRVFLTGGSSFVPAVRRIFEIRFGAQKIRSGQEFTSVARGLALRARHSS